MAIYEDENGKRTYYYYKKKIGRPKKRGPKKKKKKRGSEHQEPWNFKIVRCEFRKQDAVIGIFHNLDEVYKAKEILLEENNNIIFKKTTAITLETKKNEDYLCEYIVLEKNRDKNPNNVTKLRNGFGKLVEHTSTNEKWRIVDKFPCYIEETFWMYGFNPKTDRKTFSWITENFIEDPLGEDKLLIIRVLIYNNKIIFRYDADDIEVVICKNRSDAIKFYNILLKKYNKNKRVVFVGMTKNRGESYNKLIKLLQEKTGWQRRKIVKNNTL